MRESGVALGVLLAVFVCFGGGAIGAEESELKAVVIIFRHGARTIIHPYPNDPYKNESLWPVGFGQLTNLGKTQHYRLGQYFRKRYASFLPEKYSEKDVYVQSTDVDRTLMSAEANLAGLYPPDPSELWNPEIPWQPIPVHTRPEPEDAILAMKKPCPRYEKLYEKLMDSEEIRKINRNNAKLFEYLSEKTGTKVEDFDEMEYLFNNLRVEVENNFTLPEWTESVFPEKMKPLSDMSFALPCFNKQLALFKTGPFFHELLTYFKQFSKPNPNPNPNPIKLKIFSGHDTTIANLLQSLNLFQYHSPPYTSSIIFELFHKNQSENFVRIFYKNSTNPQQMKLPGCDYNCNFDDFNRLVSELSIPIKQWEEECKLGFVSKIEWNVENVLIASISAIVIIAILTVIIRFVYKKTKRDQSTVYLRLPDDEEQV